MASIIPVANESESSFSRFTRDGRKLTYELRVLQQPQRARACGSGAKSSADRRPVDPPPVIELKVFEGEQKTDITFHHKANFFVYTTLEAARQIAHARGQPAAQPPVLTGSPVSGAALLDRPSPAAYFIFPDLSVRHEGMYRLSFNLYEELKDPKDEDPTQIGGSGHDAALLNSNPMLAYNHVRFRMEVRSKAFQVYSAKKFPGLTESTSLSRVVAEQGCRVRIRRDVRMRRREGKGSKDSDHDDSSGYSSYPEGQAGGDIYKQQSVEQPSSAIDSSFCSPTYPTSATYSHQALPPFAASQPRPSSSQQQNHAHQHHHQLSQNPSQGSLVDTPHQAGPPPYGSSAYGTAYSTPSSHTRHPSVASNHETPAQPYQAQQPVAPPPAPHAYVQMPTHPPSGSRPGYHHDADPTEFGPKSSVYQESLVEARQLGIDAGYQATPAYPEQRPPPSVPSAIAVAPQTANSLPSIKSITSPTEVDIKPDTSSYGKGGAIEMADAGGMSGASIAASIRAGAKRGYGRTFDAGLGISMANGHRPAAVGQDVAQIETDDGLVDVDELLELKTLSYRRANGSLQTRKIPSANEVC